MFFFSRSKLYVFSFFLLLFVVGGTSLLGISRNKLYAATPSTIAKRAWKVVPSPSLGTQNNSLNGVAAISKHDIWTVGYHAGWNLIEHWNGTSWSIVPSPSLGTGTHVLSSMTALATNNVWAVGYQNSDTLIEHWNGIRWSVVPSPKLSAMDNRLTSIAAISANDIWAVGSGSAGTLTEHWNGSSWSVVPSPNPVHHANLWLTDVTAVSSNDVWAVGDYFSPVTPYANQTLVEHWNGNTWSIITSANPSNDSKFLSIVARSADDVWAVGKYEDYTINVYRALIEHWDGTTWSVVPSGSRQRAGDTELNAIAQVPGASDLWSVGDDQTGSHYGPLLTFTEHF